MIRGGAGRSHPGRSVSLHTVAAETRGRPRAGQLRPATREEAAAAAAAVVGAARGPPLSFSPAPGSRRGRRTPRNSQSPTTRPPRRPVGVSRPGALPPRGGTPGHAHSPSGRGQGRGSAVGPREGEGGRRCCCSPEGSGEPAEPPGRRQVALGHNRLPRARGRSPPFSPFLQGRDIPLKPGRREPLSPVGAFSLALFPRLSPLLPALGRAARCAFGGAGPLCAPAPHGARSNGPWGSARPVLWPAIGPLPRAGSKPGPDAELRLSPAARPAPSHPPFLCPLPPVSTPYLPAPPRPQSSLVLKSSKELARLLDHSLV
ncbi:hypothetical protein AB1E18_008999 [Capra hircus]